MTEPKPLEPNQVVRFGPDGEEIINEENDETRKLVARTILDSEDEAIRS